MKQKLSGFRHVEMVKMKLMKFFPILKEVQHQNGEEGDLSYLKRGMVALLIPEVREWPHCFDMTERQQ